MIDLYIIPIRQYYKELSFPIAKIKHLQDDHFFHKQVNTSTNLEGASIEFLSKLKLYDLSKCTLQFHKVFQPKEITENLCVTYRLIIQPDGVVADIDEITDISVSVTRNRDRDRNMDRVRDSVEISIPSLAQDSVDYTLGMSVVQDIHQSMLNTVEARTNTQGFENLLSFLPDPFDIKELSLTYSSILGKLPPLSRSLANSLLDKYQQGSRTEKDGTVVPRIVFGRDMIEEINESDLEHKVLDEKRQAFKLAYSDDFSKGGKKVSTLFRKKHPTPD